MARIYLGIGSNQGDRLANLLGAVSLLAERGVRIARASAVYETAPVGLTQQPPFLNAVLEAETDLDPEELLQATRAVEQARGRERRVRWGPRTLDVDILLYEDRELDMPGLRVPHPRMHERRFVLVPLLELEPNIEIPRQGLASERLRALDPAEQPVTRVGTLPLP